MPRLVSTSVSGVFVPEINRIVARGEGDRELSDLFIRVGRVQFMLLMVVLSGFVFVGRPFVIAWGGPEYAPAYGIGLMLMVPVTIPLIQNLGIEIQRAKNMHQFRSKVYIAMAAGNVLISVPLGMRYGGIGCAAGTAISLILGNGLVMNAYYARRIGLDIPRFWRSILSLLPAMLPAMAAALLFLRFCPVRGYRGVFCFAAAYAVLYTACVWKWGMNGEEKAGARALVGRIRARIG